MKKKLSSYNPGNQICITFQRSSVLTVRPFQLLFIYRLRFSFGVLLSQNKLVSYRFSLCVCVCVWERERERERGKKQGQSVREGDWVAWFQPSLLCKGWKDSTVHYRGFCLFPCLPENADFTVFSLWGGGTSQLLILKIWGENRNAPKLQWLACTYTPPIRLHGALF